MKSFFDIFKESAGELKKIKTITTAGIFIALALIMRTLKIQFTPDLRLTFAFIPICIIAMLYGPVVCGISTFCVDFLGFLLDPSSTGAYYPPLALVVIISGAIYGVFLYRKKISIVNILLGKASVNLICNLCLNSYFIYTGFINKGFSIFNSEDWHAFGVWIVPRVVKNVGMLPIEIIMLCIILPIADKAYKRVMKISRA